MHELDNKLDFLIYSSHKTATQTTISLLKDIYNVIHIHGLKDLTNNYNSDKLFINFLKDYKITNRKKLKILSIIRSPIDRLISSFFQTFNDDEIFFMNKEINETTISINNEKELYNNLKNKIYNDGYDMPGYKESIDEISEIFDIQILDLLQKKKNYYYYQNELFELYVLDFNKLCSKDNYIYINNILNINISHYVYDNLSKNKSYYTKYINTKKLIDKELTSLIETKFNSFYFNAF